MKKLLLAIGAAAVIAAIGTGAWFYQSLDQTVRRAIEHGARQATEASVHVERVRILPADGSGTITGFSLGSPKGFNAPTMFEAESIRITVEIPSLDKDPIVLRTLSVTSPRITYERGATSNFAALLDNIARKSDQPGRKIVVDHIVIREAKVSYASPTSAGQMITVQLPDIRLSSVGRVQGGVSAKELARAIVEVLFYHAKRAIPASALQPGA